MRSERVRETDGEEEYDDDNINGVWYPCKINVDTLLCCYCVRVIFYTHVCYIIKYSIEMNE